MILDTLKHWNDYTWPSNRFRVGFDFIVKLDPNVKDGKYPIDGEKLFCNIQTYETKALSGKEEYEAHRQYADIQCLLTGEESIFWAPQEGLKVTKPYEVDAEMYEFAPGVTELVIKPGLFCVLFPRDAHAPCVAHGKPGPARKVVVKVRLD